MTRLTLTDLVGRHHSNDAQCAPASDSPGSQSTSDTQCPDAAGAPSHPPAIDDATPIVEALAGPNLPTANRFATPIQDSPNGGDAQSAKPDSTPNRMPLTGPTLATPALGIIADIVDDLETVRIANANRLRQLCDTTEHGHGLTPDHPQVRRLAVIVDNLKADEDAAIRELQRAMREHPLGPWVKATPGVGEKQAARLLAAIRDPYWNDLHNRPRSLYELYAYTGMHTIPASHPGGQKTGDAQEANAARVAPTRRRGERINWNDQARQRVWLIAQSCIKVRHSPYRATYDAARAKYADAIHQSPCHRCGPSGHPAEPGTPLSSGHQHARAVRAMCKEILRDLWREAEKLHHPTDTDDEG